MRLAEHFFSFLAPQDCLVCGKEGELICSECAIRVLETIPGRCYRCYRTSSDSKTCPVCHQHSVLKHVWVRTSYGEVAKQIVHSLKFNYSKGVALTITKQLHVILPVLVENTLIVHVPTASSHVRQRGFDQSALIARELSRLTGMPHVHALARLGQQRQVGTSAQTRHQQMKEAFRSVSTATIEGANVLLVDDVLTTGSTLEAASLALRRAGVKSVSAVVFAQAK